MFYFTYNESKIYERFTFWNKLQKIITFFPTIFNLFEMHLYMQRERVEYLFHGWCLASKTY